MWHKHTFGVCVPAPAHPGASAPRRTHHTFTNERVPLQSTTRAPLAPQISFDVPTSAEPEHSTPRKLACALPFSVDNPAANAKWWRCSSAHSGVCATLVCATLVCATLVCATLASTHSGVYATLASLHKITRVNFCKTISSPNPTNLSRLKRIQSGHQNNHLRDSRHNQVQTCCHPRHNSNHSRDQTGHHLR